jgi:hypothetical protein
MSKRGPSRRERQMSAVVNLLRNPPYSTRQIGHLFIVEERPSPRFDPDAHVSPTDMVTLHHFHDPEEAKIFRSWKTAEKILAAIEKEVRP